MDKTAEMKSTANMTVRARSIVVRAAFEISSTSVPVVALPSRVANAMSKDTMSLMPSLSEEEFFGGEDFSA